MMVVAVRTSSISAIQRLDLAEHLGILLVQVVCVNSVINKLNIWRTDWTISMNFLSFCLSVPLQSTFYLVTTFCLPLQICKLRHWPCLSSAKIQVSHIWAVDRRYQKYLNIKCIRVDSFIMKRLIFNHSSESFFCNYKGHKGYLENICSCGELQNNIEYFPLI